MKKNNVVKNMVGKELKKNNTLKGGIKKKRRALKHITNVNGVYDNDFKAP